MQFETGDGYFDNGMKHEIPEFDSIEAALAHFEVVEQSTDTFRRHINEDDAICALVMFLARGTQYEAQVHHIIEKYYRSDKSFE